MMNAEFYMWDAGDERANAMMDAINGDARMPETMSAWVVELIEFADGRVGFKRIPDSMLQHIGIDEDEKQAMLEAYGPEIVEKTPDLKTMAEKIAEESGEF